jgi:lincosamide nucleotidyltransferase A/C/D/E
MMEPETVLMLVERLETAGITTWLDGGWGVDALVGRQTRPHADVDLVIQRLDIERARGLLERLGYEHDQTAIPGLPARLVLAGNSRVVDFHPVVFDARGNGWQELDNRAWGLYPASGLTGHGLIQNKTVRCITADLQVRHHLGYPPSPSDLRDMRALAEAFDVALPPGW